jgi:uncharacterized protein YozE (UPF0346 family)
MLRRAEPLVAMNYALEFDKGTAIRIAELLEQDGKLEAAANVWWQLGARNPHERQPRERFAELAYEAHEFAKRRPDVAKSRSLLRLMSLSFPTHKLASAYFDNLRQLLESKPKRAQPGKVIVGLGSGRCGSTTLTSAMRGVPDACATHENPPPLFWEPFEEQLRVHIERFRILTQYFAVVFDSAHWWLNSLERIFGECPDLKAIGLWRETDSCVQSFMQQKGTGQGSLNHWAVPGNGIWSASPADPWYPGYAVPASSVSDPDGAKRALVTRYVTEYNQALERIAATHLDRLLLVRTEHLSNADAYARMSDFLGLEVPMPAVPLNVGNTADGNKPELTF